MNKTADIEDEVLVGLESFYVADIELLKHLTLVYLCPTLGVYLFLHQKMLYSLIMV